MPRRVGRRGFALPLRDARQRCYDLAVKTSSRDSGGELGPFREPPWNAPFDLQRELESVPTTAQVRGMFVLPVLQEAKRLKLSLSYLRDRYLPFQLYPLRDHARLLADVAAAAYPKLSMRQALRKLGRGAPNALGNSTLGRVLLQPALGPVEVVTAFAKGYELTLEPARAVVEQRSAQCLDVTLHEVHYFVDCHHVGAFEGALHFGGVRGTVKLQRINAAEAVLRLTW
jgi:uncharacterized protein (TIGR02265 family)